MKKVILTRLVTPLMMALYPFLLPAVNTITYNATYDFNKLTLGTDTLGGVTYTTVNYDGMFNGGEPGMPSLPVDYIKFSVPYNATNFRVNATLQNNMIENLNNYLLYPCQSARMMSDTTHINITLPDNNVYNSNSFYPSQNAWVVDEGFLAGENHVVTVAVMPVSYKHGINGNITTNQLYKSQTISISLSYSLSDTLPMYPIVRVDHELRNEGHHLVQGIVVNPSQVLENAPTESYIKQYYDYLESSFNNELDTTKYSYLIITTQKYKYELRRLMALKKQLGTNVKIATVDEVVNDPNVQYGDIVLSSLDSSLEGETTFNDTIGKIRQYIRNSYLFNGTHCVLLVGNGVPYRTINLPLESVVVDTIITIPSDHYFADLHTDWRFSNSNEVIDKNCETKVGRIIANNEKQVANFINKVLRYQLNPGNGDTDYTNRVLFTTSEELCEYYSITGDVDRTKSFISGFFSDSCDMQGNGNYPSGQDVVNIINQNHFGFLSFINYSFPYGIITSSSVDNNNKHNNYLWAIDSIHHLNNGSQQEFGLNNLNNKYYPCICYTLGQTIPFDLNSESDYMNFGESFITGKDYGGPAFIGFTRDNPIRGSLYSEYQFGISLQNANFTVGSAFNNSRLFTDDFTCVSNNLLGDPDLCIWNTNRYGSPAPDSNISIARNDSSIIIMPTDTPNHYLQKEICYSSNDGSIGTALCYSQPIVLKHLSPNAMIIVKNPFKIPYIAPLDIQNAIIDNSQYVIADNVAIGQRIDPNRTFGDVIVSNGIEYEIEASGNVVIEDGFIVEKGAMFAVYPSCFK